MELEVVPENAVAVLHKEQVDCKAKKVNWRCRSGGGGGNEWSKIPKLVETETENKDSRGLHDLAN